MNRRIRILVLCACAAVGAAVAFALAWKTEPVTVAQEPLTGASKAKSPSAPSVNDSAKKPVSEATGGKGETTPQNPFVDDDPVASQILSLEESLQQVRQENDEQRKQVQSALNQLTERVETKTEETPEAGSAPSGGASASLSDTSPSQEELPEGSPGIRDEGDGRLSVDLQNTDILAALKLLNGQGLNILASKNVTGTVTASLRDIDAETALAAILRNTNLVARREKGIIYVGTKADFIAMDQSEDHLAMRVYRPNYIKASDLQTLITPMLTPQTGVVTVSSPSQVDIPSDQTKTGANDFAGSDVVVVKDYEAVLRQVDALYEEVDVKPSQVAIEAMILNVKLNDKYQMGVNLQALRDKEHARIVTGSNVLTSLASLDVANGGLKFGFLDSSLSAFLLALEEVGDVNVVASPRVLCMNKQRAEIQIGQQLGYVNTTVTQTFSTQSVSFLDVGTLLRIRPFIGNDGFIRMEVHPELSTGIVSLTGGLTIPDKSVTQVTSNVGCRDGSTIVIGGLMRQDLQNTVSQVPFVGNLPWVGPLFRHKTEEHTREEIIVLITPRIVTDDILCQDGIDAGNQFLQRQGVYFDKLSPIAKRNYALRYQRLALAAFNAGDYPRAIKQIDWSIHWDPMNRDAINLRNDIVAAGGFEDESIHQYLNHARAPWNRPHLDYSKRGAPWKPGPAFGAFPQPVAEPDPGTPGQSRTLPGKYEAKSP